jgi:hypothetical protein
MESVEPFACIPQCAILLEVNEFGVEDLDQVFLGDLEIVIGGVEKDMFTKVFLIDLHGEFAYGIVRDVLAAEIVIFILQFKDEHHIFPCVFEADTVGDISEYHFNGIIETVVE